MYGLISKLTAVAGRRDALATILLDASTDMPGCLSYVVATDPADADGLWVTEVWADAASHQASLQHASVQQAITRARPLIASISHRAETKPLGGHRLNS